MSRISSLRIPVITLILFALGAIAVSANWGSGNGFRLSAPTEAAKERTAVTSQPRVMTTPLNAITSFDAVVIVRHIFGTSLFPTNNHFCAGDITNNGNITSNDAANVARYAIGSSSTGLTGTTVAAPCHANFPTTDPVLKGELSSLDPGYSTGHGSVNVALPAITPLQGAVTIPITVSNMTGLDILSYQFQITYDPSVLHPAGFGLTCHEEPPGGNDTCFDQTGTLSSTKVVYANASNAGHLMITSFAGSQPFSGSGTLLNLKFDVVGSAGQSTALTFENYIGPDSRAYEGFLFNEGQAEAVTTNGSVTVSGDPASPTPTATNTGTATPTATATATSTGTPGSVPVSVSLPDVSAAEGSNITIPITVGNINSLGVISYDLQITYDPAVLQPANPVWETSGTLSSSLITSVNGDISGHLIGGAFQGVPFGGSGTLLKLRFTVVGTSGQSTALTFEDYMGPGNNPHPGFEFNEGNPASTKTNGSVTVVAPGGAAIAGRAMYGNAIGGQAERYVPDAFVDGLGSTGVWTMTDVVDGDYSLSGFGAGAYTVMPSKTGGQNGAISSFDAARIAQHVSGVSFLAGNQLAVAEVSGNGAVTSFDAAQVAAYAAALPGAGTTGNWRFSPESRSYASVSSVTGEDYTALLMGEVSGNWQNTGGRPVVSQTSARNAKISVAAPRLLAQPGTEVLIPVSINGAAKRGVISYEFDLMYDPGVIHPQAVAADLAGTVSRGLSVVTNSIEPGLLRVVVYGPMPIDSDGVLLNLRFTAVGKSGSVSPLTWERIMFNEGEARVNTTDGQVELF